MTKDPNDLERGAKRDAGARGDEAEAEHAAAATQASYGARSDPEEDGWTQPESSAQKCMSPSQSWLAPEGS